MKIYKFTALTIANRKILFSMLILSLTVCSFASSVSAQRRDHLTEAEVELVRDAQRIDDRMKVFVHAVDRRFLALNNPAAPAKVEKNQEVWGDAPIGTRQQLVSDIEKLLDEAISKIDDVASRDMASEYFPSAVHILADGARRFQPMLKSELDKAADEKERGAILGAIEFCDEIITASAKVKNESPKEIKKRKEKETKEER